MKTNKVKSHHCHLALSHSLATSTREAVKTYKKNSKEWAKWSLFAVINHLICPTVLNWVQHEAGIWHFPQLDGFCPSITHPLHYPFAHCLKGQLHSLFMPLFCSTDVFVKLSTCQCSFRFYVFMLYFGILYCSPFSKLKNNFSHD